MHITGVSADGICADFAPAMTGRVVRMDVDAAPEGELVLTILGLDMYGGHADGQVWADADLSEFGWGWGYDDPVTSDPYEIEVEVERGEDAGEASAPSEAPAASYGGCSEPQEQDYEGDEDGEFEEEDGEFEEEECGTVTHHTDAGIFVSIDAGLSSAIAMDGILAITVSNGYGSCTFEAEFDASHISDEDDEEDVDLMAHPEDVEPLHPQKEDLPAPAEEPAD